jgi:hypothetical protein
MPLPDLVTSACIRCSAQVTHEPGEDVDFCDDCCDLDAAEDRS